MKRSEALSALTAKMELQHKALDTVKAYRNALNKHITWLVGHPELKKAPPARRIEAYLTARVQEDDISPSTQNVELNALLYFHREVLGLDVQGINALRAQSKLRVPHVLSREQVTSLLANLPAPYNLIARLLYGAGLRVNEALRLRIKDLDFAQGKLILHQAKGDKERLVPLPESLRADLKTQLNHATACWRQDHLGGYGVHLPRALEKKYRTLHTSKDWYWLFPADSLSVDPRSKRTQRHHIKDFTVQRAFLEARRALHLPEYTTPHSLRHAFATHLAEHMLGQRFPREMVESKIIEYLGHASRDTLKYYLHLAAPKDALIVLPLEQLESV
jgi:integron integrase